MPGFSERRVGGTSIVAASALLGTYGALFSITLPAIRSSLDYSRAVLSPWWVPLTTLAFAGVLLMLAGLDALYERARPSSGRLGWTGLVVLKLALILQACKLTWELFLDPIIRPGRRPLSSAMPSSSTTPRSWSSARFPRSPSLPASVLFGVPLYRSGLLPRRAAALIAAGALLYAIGSDALDARRRRRRGRPVDRLCLAGSARCGTTGRILASAPDRPVTRHQTGQAYLRFFFSERTSPWRLTRARARRQSLVGVHQRQSRSKWRRNHDAANGGESSDDLPHLHSQVIQAEPRFSSTLHA